MRLLILAVVLLAYNGLVASQLHPSQRLILGAGPLSKIFSVSPRGSGIFDDDDTGAGGLNMRFPKLPKFASSKKDDKRIKTIVLDNENENDNESENELESRSAALLQNIQANRNFQLDKQRSDVRIQIGGDSYKPSYGSASPKYGGSTYGNPTYGGSKYGDSKYGDSKYGDSTYGNPTYGSSSYRRPMSNDNYSDDSYSAKQKSTKSITKSRVMFGDEDVDRSYKKKSKKYNKNSYDQGYPDMYASAYQSASLGFPDMGYPQYPMPSYGQPYQPNTYQPAYPPY